MAVLVRSCRNGGSLFQAAEPKKLKASFTELVSCPRLFTFCCDALMRKVGARPMLKRIDASSAQYYPKHTWRSFRHPFSTTLHVTDD